jgi:hypothetical protein
MSLPIEVMLDLETLSTRNCAAIAVISAIKFRRDGNGYFSQPFYELVDLGSCEQVNMHVDNKTIEWWKKQPESLQKEIFEGKRRHLKEVLIDFKQWYGKSNLVWSQGATFDIPILEEAFRRWSLEPPWKFWQARDTRTIYDLAGMKSSDLPGDNMHNALEDCKRQVWGVQEAFKRIKNK